MEYTFEIHIMSPPSDVTSYPVFRLPGGHHILPQADVLHGGDDVHLTPHSRKSAILCREMLEKFGKSREMESRAALSRNCRFRYLKPPFLSNLQLHINRSS